MKNYYICIDIGGTDIKCGVVDEDYNIMYKTKIKTQQAKKEKSLLSSFKQLFDLIENETKLRPCVAKGVGIGFPGLVDNKEKQVKFMSNLNLTNYDEILMDLKSLYSGDIKFSNDAELALLAEKTLGAGKGKDNFVLLTLGTGLGCGIVLDGKPLRQVKPFSCELGHLKSVDSGNEYGSYASTRALISQTRTAMENNLESKLWTKYNLSTISGSAVFEFKEKDKTAKQVFNNYIKNLGTIIANLHTLFSVDLFVIGGGISGQGEALTKPLEEFVNKNTFTKVIGEKVKIVPAKFSNDAGILGARCMFDKEGL